MSSEQKSGYEDEPVEQFLELPVDHYCRFYDLERRHNQDDRAYYLRTLRKYNCKNVLELGCGTGRVQEFLKDHGLNLYGIDTSREMLSFNRSERMTPVCEMDMRHLGLNKGFDAAILAHNTLCLLPGADEIRRSLAEIKRVLKTNGLLIVQLFVITPELKAQAGKRLFQFALFDIDDKTKLIKETIRTYLPESETLRLEERYKLRSFDCPFDNRNYRQLLSLTALPASKWIELIHASGFTLVSLHADDGQREFDQTKDSTLLLCAHS